MVFGDLPTAWHETVECALHASTVYGVPANIVLAVAEVENGHPYLPRQNANGSLDFGRMQTNSVHLRELNRHGITDHDLRQGGCYPIQLATWMLGGHIQRCNGEFWRCVANYHSTTPAMNQGYRSKLLPAASRWAHWLTAHVPTIEFKRVKE